MVPSGNQNGINIDAKIAHFLDDFEIRLWMGFLMDFRNENGSILAPKWNQKSRLASKARFLENSGFP